MKKATHSLILCLLGAGGFTACSDYSEIGNELVAGNVVITKDSIFDISGESVYTPVFDSRSTTNLLGRIDVPLYGSLKTSFVTELLSVPTLSIPDSIGVDRVDSLKLFVRMPRNTVTGDSLAPQQLSVYRLNKQLPSDITNVFNPEGYYDPSDLYGRKAFSMSNLGMNDSLYLKATKIDVGIKLPYEEAVKVFTDYRQDPSIFAWPQTFKKYFPGLYVESSFGSGCMATVSSVEVVLYTNHRVLRTYSDSEGGTYQKEMNVKDSVTVFSTAPEVLSSNCITYKPTAELQARIASGDKILVTPAGYNVRFQFPLEEVMAKYRADNRLLTVINDLSFTIPAKALANDHGISITPNLLMVKTSEVDEFFANNTLPDQRTSFFTTYSTDAQGFVFSELREYLLDMLAKDVVEPDDYDFTLVPVYITTESYTDYTTYKEVTVVTSCTPYIFRPTMTLLNLEKAKVEFTYSKQQM